MKKPELLAPVGSFEKAKTAFKYGADAIYVGTSNLSLRTRVDMNDDELAKIIEYAHSINKKVYVALNIYARDNMYEEIKKQVKILDEIKADAVIVSDGGVVETVKEVAPNLEIHISTQANTVSYHAANFWYKNGAKRVILGREMNKEQIKQIRNDLKTITSSLQSKLAGNFYAINYPITVNAAYITNDIIVQALKQVPSHTCVFVIYFQCPLNQNAAIIGYNLGREYGVGLYFNYYVGNHVYKFVNSNYTLTLTGL